MLLWMDMTLLYLWRGGIEGVERVRRKD